MIILNEKEFVEDFLKTDQTTDRPVYMTSLLARYYYHCKGMRGEKLINVLLDFLEKRCPSITFSKGLWIDKIEEIIANAKNSPLYEIDGIWLTASELETVSFLNNEVLERLAFTILCLAKLNLKRHPNGNGWINVSYKEIFKLARISDSPEKRLERLGELYQKGYFEMSGKLENLSLRITYIDNSSPDTLFISDFRELAYEYLKYKGKNFIRCGECGILVRGNKNGTKLYCTDCLRDRIYVPPMEIKAKRCVDCGDLFEISSKNNQSTRCPHCQMIHRRAYKADHERKRRNIAP